VQLRPLIGFQHDETLVRVGDRTYLRRLIEGYAAGDKFVGVGGLAHDGHDFNGWTSWRLLDTMMEVASSLTLSFLKPDANELERRRADAEDIARTSAAILAAILSKRSDP